jgi:hypothetical protein
LKGRLDTRFYKLGELEKALVQLKISVARPQDMRPLHLAPTSTMMLLEAARWGLHRFYEHPELLDRLEYPFP